MNYSKDAKRAPFIKNFTSLIKRRRVRRGARERKNIKFLSCSQTISTRNKQTKTANKNRKRDEREKKLIAKRSRLRRKAAAS